MDREQILYCFSALTWNLELLCTLSFKGSTSSVPLAGDESPSDEHQQLAVVGERSTAIRQFSNTTVYLEFVQSYLEDVEDYVTALILARVVPVTDRNAVVRPLATPAGEERRVERLLEGYPTFYAHTSRALKPGDARRRSAQHIVRHVYLSGKHPALQPLLLEFLGVRRIVQAYAGAELLKPRGGGGSGSANAAASLRTSALVWEPMPWPDTQVPPQHAALPGGAWCRSRQGQPLEDLSAPTRGLLFSSRLPISQTQITKLVIPAVDDDAYDLRQHFWEDDIFAFMSGASLGSPHSGAVSSDVTYEGPVLVHCSAGMHRSPAFVVAYMIREHIKAGDPLDGETGKPRTVDGWCEFVKTKRSVSMPTDTAKEQLADFLHELRGATRDVRDAHPPQPSKHMQLSAASVPFYPRVAAPPCPSPPSVPTPPLGASGSSTPPIVPSSPWLAAVVRGQSHHDDVPAVSLGQRPPNH